MWQKRYGESYMVGGIKKTKIVKICTDIQEANHAMWSVIQYSNRSNGVLDRNNLPWLLTKQQSNDVKEVIQRIKFPMGFASNIKNILTKKGEFGGVKTHDWHTFIKVIILVYIFIYIGLIDLLFIFIFSCLLWLKQITIHFVVIVCSTTISPKWIWQQCQTSYIWSWKIHEVRSSCDLYEKCSFKLLLYLMTHVLLVI